ncbi:MAG: hypothetical protein EP315_07795 [Gammaproteobacteria bacterium]|nr:MAG: hypothetical protein EP315_07795 [Gammaproteobacteria bacterium]
MIKSIASINTLLVDIKTANNPLAVKLQQCGFDLNASIGIELEYTVQSLLQSIDALAIQFLTITASRKQFIQRTAYAERKQIEDLLGKLFICLRNTQCILEHFKQKAFRVVPETALGYIADNNSVSTLPLEQAIEHLDMLKPYSRMLELVTAQERIHALSAVLETLLNKEYTASSLSHEDDHELTEEQYNALELSNYLIKQAL